MGNKLLSSKERFEKGRKLTEFIQEILGAKNIGIVRKASIKAEVNEPLEIELKISL